MPPVMTEHAVLRFALRRRVPVDRAQSLAWESYRRATPVSREEVEAAVCRVAERYHGVDVAYLSDGYGAWVVYRAPSGQWRIVTYYAPGQDEDHARALLQAIAAEREAG